MSVKTGDLPRAETDAHVFCNLIGQWGSSGQRSLAVSSHEQKFRVGQVQLINTISLFHMVITFLSDKY